MTLVLRKSLWIILNYNNHLPQTNNMIKTRNHTLVIGKMSVPVRNITDSIIDRKNMNYITKRFPVSVEEVFECIDTIADIETFNGTGHLSVRNNGSNDDVVLECTAISDVLWLKLIQYGRIFASDIDTFHKLFDKGFRMCAIECLDDIVNDRTDFESSELHNIVFDAITSVVHNGVNYQSMLDLLKGQDESKV